MCSRKWIFLFLLISVKQQMFQASMFTARSPFALSPLIIVAQLNHSYWSTRSQYTIDSCGNTLQLQPWRYRINHWAIMYSTTKRLWMQGIRPNHLQILTLLKLPEGVLEEPMSVVVCWSNPPVHLKLQLLPNAPAPNFELVISSITPDYFSHYISQQS